MQLIIIKEPTYIITQCVSVSRPLHTKTGTENFEVNVRGFFYHVITCKYTYRQRSLLPA